MYGLSSKVPNYKYANRSTTENVNNAVLKNSQVRNKNLDNKSKILESKKKDDTAKVGNKKLDKNSKILESMKNDDTAKLRKKKLDNKSKTLESMNKDDIEENDKAGDIEEEENEDSEDDKNGNIEENKNGNTKEEKNDDNTNYYMKKIYDELLIISDKLTTLNNSLTPTAISNLKDNSNEEHLSD